MDNFKESVAAELAFIRKKQEAKNIAWKREMELKSPKEEMRTKKILSFLSDSHAQLLWQNGYVFEFILAGRYYSICDQLSRIVGESWLDVPELRKDIANTLREDREESTLRTMINFRNIFIEATMPDSLEKLFSEEFEYRKSTIQHYDHIS